MLTKIILSAAVHFQCRIFKWFNI